MWPPPKTYCLAGLPGIPLHEIQALALAFTLWHFPAEVRERLAEMIVQAQRDIPPALADFLAALQGTARSAAPLPVPLAGEFRLGFPSCASAYRILPLIPGSVESAGNLYRLYESIVRSSVRGHRGLLDDNGQPVEFRLAQGEQGILEVAPFVMQHYRKTGILWPIGFFLVGLFDPDEKEAPHVG